MHNLTNAIQYKINKFCFISQSESILNDTFIVVLMKTYNVIYAISSKKKLFFYYQNNNIFICWEECKTKNCKLHSKYVKEGVEEWMQLM